TSLLNVDVQPGKPPVLRVEAVGEAARWAADYRNALRSLVAEHGALLVRGLGLRDVAQIDTVFRQLGNLMTETEAFAPRQRYVQGVYSASKWPLKPLALTTVTLLRVTAVPTRSSSTGKATGRCAPGSAAAPSCVTRSPPSGAGSTRLRSSTNGR